MTKPAQNSAESGLPLLAEEAENKHFKNTLRKGERLYLRGEIRLLLAQGKSFTLPHLRVVWHVLPEAESRLKAYPVRVLFGAPKRNFRLATRRNLVKRRLREAYRTRKHDLLAHMRQTQSHLLIAFFVQGKVPPDYATLAEEVALALGKLLIKLQGA